MVAALDTRTFNQLRSIVYETSGIALGPHKQAMVCARVSKRMRALGIPRFDEYLRYLRADGDGDELTRLLDVISTNVTSFFREPRHFEILSGQMAGWTGGGQRRFRLWSAACSSGEEAYSLAMTAAEATRGTDADVRILATDISTQMLTRCRQAVYGSKEIKSVSPDLRRRYTDCGVSGGRRTYRMCEDIRRMVVFARLNLSRWPFPMRGPLDAIMCRNVMIYFDDEIRTGLLGEMFRLLRPGGLLFVGQAESLAGMVSDFQTVCPSVYVRAR